MNRLTWFSAILIIALFAQPVAAQLASGEVVGTVMTKTGDPLPGVVVEITSTEGLRRTAVTDPNGNFRIPSLPVGSYELVAMLEGFATVTESVVVGVARSTSIELTLGQYIDEQISVTSSSEEARSYPSWNTWFEVKDAAEGIPVERLKVGTYYDFYLDLSRFPYQRAGVESSSIRDTMLDELKRVYFANPRRLKLTAHVRPVLVGRALRLLDDRLQASRWHQGAWVESPSRGMVPFEVRVADLLGEGGQESLLDPGGRELSDAARAGGVRFPVLAERAGCAAVALSIWDEGRRVPIDYVVHIVAVGDANCEAAAGEEELRVGFLTALYGAEGSESQGALQLLELNADSGLSRRTVAVYVPETPASGCDHFAWEVAGTLSSYLFEQNRAFKDALQRAWDSLPPSEPDLYPKVAERLRRLIFPQAKDPRTDCGGWEALQSLRELAEAPGRSVFVHFVNRAKENLFVPLGLLFTLEEPGSGKPQRVFVNPPSLRQALSTEISLEPERCVGNWTFILPEELGGDTTKVELPPSVAAYGGTRRSLDGLRELIKTMRNRHIAPEDPALGIVILAHHMDGELYLDDPDNDFWLWTEFDDVKVPDGSVAVLSACSAGDLSQSRNLVTSLSRAGFDTIILSPFDIYTPFGAAFAVNFSEQVVDSLARAEETRVGELFARALSATVGNLEGELGHVARGMALEFLIAGHSGMRLCGRSQAEN